MRHSASMSYGNMKIYLHFLSFLNSGEAQVVKILPHSWETRIKLLQNRYGSGHETVAVLLPGFAID